MEPLEKIDIEGDAKTLLISYFSHFGEAELPSVQANPAPETPGAHKYDSIMSHDVQQMYAKLKRKTKETEKIKESVNVGLERLHEKIKNNSQSEPPNQPLRTKITRTQLQIPLVSPVKSCGTLTFFQTNDTFDSSDFGLKTNRNLKSFGESNNNTNYSFPLLDKNQPQQESLFPIRNKRFQSSFSNPSNSVPHFSGKSRPKNKDNKDNNITIRDAQIKAYLAERFRNILERVPVETPRNPRPYDISMDPYVKKVFQREQERQVSLSVKNMENVDNNENNVQKLMKQRLISLRDQQQQQPRFTKVNKNVPKLKKDNQIKKINMNPENYELNYLKREKLYIDLKESLPELTKETKREIFEKYYMNSNNKNLPLNNKIKNTSKNLDPFKKLNYDEKELISRRFLALGRLDPIVQDLKDLPFKNLEPPENVIEDKPKIVKSLITNLFQEVSEPKEKKPSRFISKKKVQQELQKPIVRNKIIAKTEFADVPDFSMNLKTQNAIREGFKHSGDENYNGRERNVLFKRIMTRLPESNNLVLDLDHRIEKKYNRKIKHLNETFSFYKKGLWNIFLKVEDFSDREVEIQEFDEFLRQTKVQFTLLNTISEPIEAEFEGWRKKKGEELEIGFECTCKDSCLFHVSSFNVQKFNVEAFQQIFGTTFQEQDLATFFTQFINIVMEIDVSHWFGQDSFEDGILFRD